MEVPVPLPTPPPHSGGRKRGKGRKASHFRGVLKLKPTAGTAQSRKRQEEENFTILDS